jgi:predicted dehydrogenase
MSLNSEDSPNVSRRSFIAGAAGVAATAALANSVFAAAPAAAAGQPAPANGRKVGFALMGIGTLSTGQIIPQFPQCQYAKPVAMVTGHKEKNLPLAKQLGIAEKNIYNYDNYDSIKDNPEIEVVYNVLPNDMHAEFTIRAFKAGKHVLCEKPMATSVADCEAMIKAGKDAKKKLFIAYRMQYEPVTLKAIELAKGLGDIRAITTEAGFVAGRDYTPANYWRLNKKQAGGGALMDMGVYGLQAIRFLSGQEPSSVTAISFQPKNNPQFSEVEMTMMVTLQFPSGMEASILTSYGVSCNRWRAYGTAGVLEMEPMQAYSGNRLYSGRGPQRTEIKGEDIPHFANEMDQMALDVINNREPKTNGEEGLKDMKILMAAFESAKTGKTVMLA